MKDEELIAFAEKLKGSCYSCKKCSLGQVDSLDGFDPHVFGVGNVCANIVFLAEAPGFEETKLRQPLVGRSGKLFNKIILEGLGLKRNDVWITNTVLCRPPKNRKPISQEIKYCSEHFEKQIELIKPKVIITLGAVPLNYLASISNGITKIATKPLKSEEYNLDIFPLLHPSYILRTGKYELLGEHVVLLKRFLLENNILK